MNCIDYERDNVTERIHPTQKSVKLLERLIKLFTNEGDVVIDPCAGSASTILAAINCNRSGYGFEIKKDFYNAAKALIDKQIVIAEETKRLGFSPTILTETTGHPSLF